MYVVTDKRNAWMRVEWSTLAKDGSQLTESFRMKVELVPLEEFEEFLTIFAGQHDGGKGPLDFIARVASDWDEIVDEDKKPFPFTPENLGIVIRGPGFLTGWQLSYIRAWQGQPQEREKNSESSPPDGPAGEGSRAARRARPSRQKPSPRKPASKRRPRS